MHTCIESIADFSQPTPQLLRPLHITYICIYTYIYILTYICMYVHIYMYVCVYVCVHEREVSGMYIHTSSPLLTSHNLRPSSCGPCAAYTYAYVSWRYIRPRMEKSHPCWPRTADVWWDVCHKNEMRPMIRANGALYSLLNFNSRLVSSRLKYV